METATKKRERSGNFTKEEVRLLMKLVVKYKHIVENKKTDAVTNNEKLKAWMQITKEFNASSGLIRRSPNNLKLKYESIKKGAKKKTAANRQQLYYTGGGKPSLAEFTDSEKTVLEICSNIGGLEARHDSDALPGPAVESQIHAEPSNMEFDEPDFDLTQNEVNIYEIVVQDAEEKQISVSENETFITPSRSEKIPMKPTQEAVKIDEEELHLPVNDWSNWNPKSLKSKKSKALTHKYDLTNKLESIASARLNLVNIQIEAAKTELQLNKELIDQHRLEHQKKMQVIEIELEIAKIKLAKE